MSAQVIGGIVVAFFAMIGAASWIGVLGAQWMQRRNTAAQAEKTKAEQELVRAEASDIFNRIATEQTEHIMKALQDERAESRRWREEAMGLRTEVEHLRNEVTALRRQLEADAAERRQEREDREP